MAVFEIAVQRALNVVETVREVRKFSAMSISEVQRRLGTDEPLVVISSEDHPLDLYGVDGYRHQHSLFLRAYEALIRLGDSVRLFYRPAPGDPAEEVDLVSVKNLMEGELIYLKQEYD